MTTDQVLLFLDDIRKRLTIISLTEDDYYSTLSASASEGILGGTIYDAVIARCALKSNCDVIYTWNNADFNRLGTDVAKRMQTP